MTLKEFLEKNPSAVEEAASCKSVEEFKKLAEKVGITFKNSDEAEQAFHLVQQQHNGELSEDALDAVSGGHGDVKKIDPKKISTNYDGETIYTGSYKKVK